MESVIDLPKNDHKIILEYKWKNKQRFKEVTVIMNLISLRIRVTMNYIMIHPSTKVHFIF